MAEKSIIDQGGKQMKTRVRSFTLIELLVVIAIIAILSRSKNSFFLLFSAI